MKKLLLVGLIGLFTLHAGQKHHSKAGKRFHPKKKKNQKRPQFITSTELYLLKQVQEAKEKTIKYNNETYLLHNGRFYNWRGTYSTYTLTTGLPPEVRKHFASLTTS